MNCVACKQTNAPDRNYCGGCGTPLARYCTLCGFRNAVSDRFCGGCGGDLATSPRSAATRREAGTARPEPPAAPAGSAGSVGSGGTGEASLADLLQAAQETAAPAGDDAEVKVSQDDIDSLFGE